MKHCTDIARSRGRILTAVGIILILITGYFIYLYFAYVNTAGFRIPIMDFCRWIAWYGEKIHTGTMDLLALFTDKNEQIQPLALGIDFGIMEASNYNMWPLVISGAILRAILAVFMAWILLRETKGTEDTGSRLFAWTCAAAIVIMSLNPNQWELVIEPFTLTMAIRICCFFGAFLMTERLLQGILDKAYRMQILSVLLLAFVSAFIAVLLSGAYIVAFLGAISGAFLVFCVINRKEIRPKHIPLMAIWGMTVMACLIFYITSMPGGSIPGVHASIAEYLKGFMIYIGTAVVPQNLCETTLTPFLIVGIIICAVTVYLLIVYFRKRKDKINYIPLLLIAYAAINGAVIAYGRVNLYGAGTMASSRYTVESIIGLIGVVWLGILCYPMPVKGIVRKVILWACVIAVFVGLAGCYKTEGEIAIYRAAYQDGMKEKMLTINQCTDDELNVFQESPEYTRTMTAFFQKYNLSVFETVNRDVE